MTGMFLLLPSACDDDMAIDSELSLLLNTTVTVISTKITGFKD
jgi:hypothetical protein